MLDILMQFNWFDLFILILIARICYISVKTGFVVELFKLAGTICSVYLALHFYMSLGAKLQGNSFVIIPAKFFDFLCFLALVGLGYFIFFLLRTALYRFMEVKTMPALGKWGGLAVGIARSIFLASLIAFIFSISTVAYLKNSRDKSYIGSRISAVAPATYSWIWNNLTSKFSPKENLNTEALNK